MPIPGICSFLSSRPENRRLSDGAARALGDATKVRGWIGGDEWCTHMVGAKAPVFVVAHSSSGLGRCPLKAETTGSNPVWVTSHS